MRRTYHAQLPLTSVSAHTRAAELCVMSAVLDANPGVLGRVQADLLRQRKADARRGREGMTAEQVVRAALVKQMFGSSYEELAFQLGDSLVLRGFCRLSPSARPPKRSALQANIASIRPDTWEAMNKALVLHARDRKIEDGRWMRTDTTVVESNIHHPLDSSLLFDAYACSRARSCGRTRSTARPAAITDDARSDEPSRFSTRAPWRSAFRSTRTCSRSRTRP
jgi:IS5 family transposase